MSIKNTIDSICPPFLRKRLNSIEESPLGYRLAKGMFWSMAGAVISRGLMLVASIFVARMFGKNVYGELGMINSTVGMFGVFAGFGLGVTATKHVAEFCQKDPCRTGRILGLSGLFAITTGGVISLGVYLFAPWLAAHTINAPHLSNLLRISSLMLFISALNGAQTGALSGFEAFKTIAKVNLYTGLISFPILLCGAYLGGLTGAVWALTINLSINWMFNHIALRREAIKHQIPFSITGCFQEWPILWKFSLPAVLSASMAGPVNWVCSAMLVNRPGGYAEIGLFSAANQWYGMLLFLPGLLGGAVLPILSERLGENDTKQTMRTLYFALKTNLLFVVPIIVLASFASPYIMGLYGDSFRSGWPTLIVVLFTAGILAVQTPVGLIISASGKMWLGFAMNCGWAVIFIISTLLLLDFGALGLASARALSYFIHSFWVFIFVIYTIRKT